jgi:hypothetical protein
MVPYTTMTRSTSSSSCDSTTSTTELYDNYYHEGDEKWYGSLISKEEDLSLPIPREKPKFDRVMKMRNMDGRPIKYFTWKPVRIYNGRDNIGIRNFKKLN